MRNKEQTPEIDVSSFMNLMVVLVPILLLSMSLSAYQTIRLEFDTAEMKESVRTSDKHQVYEVLNNSAGLKVIDENNKNVFSSEGSDYSLLNDFMFSLKNELLEQKKEASILVNMGHATSYQDSIDTLAAVTSYQLENVASVADVVLFESVSFSDIDDS